MNLKTLKGCHFANYREAWEANRLVCEARIHPTMSKVFPLDETGEAAYQVHHNLAEGKVGVLVPRARRGPRRDRRGDCARSTSTRSRCSVGSPTDGVGPHMLLTEIDHVAIAVNDLEAAIDYYRDTFGVRGRAPRGRRARRRRGGAAEGRRLVHPAAHADPRRLDRRQVPRRRRARASTTSATGSTTAPPRSSG